MATLLLLDVNARTTIAATAFAAAFAAIAAVSSVADAATPTASASGGLRLQRRRDGMHERGRGCERAVRLRDAWP